MPAPKTLLDHVVDRSFRAERHARLLESEILPRTPPTSVDRGVWFALRDLQAEYAEATRPSERTAICREFAARCVKIGEPRRKLALTWDQVFWAVAGCQPSRRLAGMTEAEDRATRRRFREWMDEWADAFRADLPCPPPPSLTEPAKVLAVDRRPRKPGPTHVRFGDAARARKHRLAG